MRVLYSLKMLGLGSFLVISLAFMGAKVSYAGFDGVIDEFIFDGVGCTTLCLEDYAECILNNCVEVNDFDVLEDIDAECVEDCSMSADACVNDCVNND